MAEVYVEWAGKERLFRLSFGNVLALEEACSEAAIGAIFQRLSSGTFRAAEVYHTLRLALIGGGLPTLDAKQLMEKHFDHTPLLENAALAGDILIALMTGVESDEAHNEGDPEPIKFSEISQVCRTFHVSPDELRAMSYADVVNMIRGFNAANSDKTVEPITEEEFRDILARYEPDALKDLPS